MKVFRTMEVREAPYKVGDVISFTLNDGEEVEALAVKQEEDMIFYFQDALRKEYRMNKINSNRGGYKGCELRANLNGEILDRFPAEIREKMVAFENGYFLRLATEREIFGENIRGVEEDDSVDQWEPMKKRKNRIAFRGKGTDSWEWYWLQNKYEDSTACFTCVNDFGGADYFHAAYCDLGVRPAFKIKNHQHKRNYMLIVNGRVVEDEDE